MKAVFSIENDKINFEGVDYPAEYFIIKIYRRLLSVKDINYILKKHPDYIHSNIAWRLIKGEKLDIHSYIDIDKLSLYQIHNITPSKYKKYLFIKHYFHDNNYDGISIKYDDFIFVPHIKAWYDESKLLNETSFKTMVDEHVYELNQSLKNFESMVYYHEYSYSEYKNYITSNIRVDFRKL